MNRTQRIYNIKRSIQNLATPSMKTAVELLLAECEVLAAELESDRLQLIEWTKTAADVKDELTTLREQLGQLSDTTKQAVANLQDQIKEVDTFARQTADRALRQQVKNEGKR